MDLIIKNGTVVTASGIFAADIGVEQGKIKTIAEKIEGAAAKVVDAKGLYVLPGAVDVHTHLQMPFGGTVSADGYQSGTRAAVCGGVTTVFDYAIQRKGKGILETVKERQALAEGGACSDYAFHCAITNLGENAELLDEFPAAADYGVSSFKCFMVYRKEGMMIDDGQLMRILEKAKDVGILTNVHAENPDVIDARIAAFLKEGKTSAWYHYQSRPEFVEAEAVKRAIHWAVSANAPLYIVHLACKEGLEAVAEARSQGYPIFAETCPQYLEFTSDVYKREDGRNFVCSPPMKGPESQAALWKGIQLGVIDTVATDHCPFKQAEKDWGKDNFTKIPNGCAGIENLYPYMLSAANSGKISFSRAVELCAETPAALFGCTAKGSITVGKDADLVLYDPKKNFEISVKNMHSDYDNTIWEGKKLKGYPVQTYLRGTLVYDNGSYVGVPGSGRYIKRGASGRK
ncbi:dihydropyrimidinase [Treponema primitia ZAS-2]|uniref:Dihydropyrimidinase n=2 Tax=Treponema primitia TaxID=88058 RepID=F5YM78_TREPZ|nr:dihydropyrimidinase [Treponema primitia ZAS-2]